MATITKTKTVDFGAVKVNIKIEKGTWIEQKYFDGYETGTETHIIDRFTIEMVNGANKKSSNAKPTVISDDSRSLGGIRDNMAKAGCYYACDMSGIGFKKESGDKVLEAIAELEAEVAADIDDQTEKEIAEIEKTEAEKESKARKIAAEEAERYEKNIESGMCPKCGTWCYGDCGAN